MEDSGREKLQGQASAPVDEIVNKPESENSNISFHSDKINDGKKEEHFTNVEGAEARARAAEKAKEEAQKAAEREEERAAKELKKAEETPLQKKARHKKYAIIACIVFLVLAVVGALLYWKLSYDNVSPEKAKEDALAIFVEAKGIQGNGNAENRKKAREFFEQKIEKSSGTHKFYNLLSYVDYLRMFGYDILDCEEFLKQAEELAETDEMKLDLLQRKCEIYAWFQDDRLYTDCDDLPKYDEGIHMGDEGGEGEEN